MVPEPGVEPGAQLRESYEAKAVSELAAADALVTGSAAIAGSGALFADVVLLKGHPGEEDRAAGRALAGADGQAADKVLVALGIVPARAWRMCTRVTGTGGRDAGAGASAGTGDHVTGVGAGMDSDDDAAEMRARRVELAVEAVDPDLVIALDPEAGQDLARAFGLARLEAGVPAEVRGRVIGAVSGLAASLGDERAKARVWVEFRAVAGERHA